MASEQFESLRKEIDKGFYRIKTITNFFGKAPLKELNKGYEIILRRYYSRKSSVEFIEEKIKQGYTRESACRAFASSWILLWLEEKDEIKKRVFSEISDLKNASERGKESLLIKSIS